MADNITLSLLMRDSYENKDTRGGAAIEKLGFVNLGKGSDEESSGFRAQAYINTETREIVLAVAGTDGLSDVLPDINFGFSSAYHQQFYDGLEYANGINNLVESEESIYAGYKVITTGHSLGGGHAQIFSHTFGWDGMT